MREPDGPYTLLYEEFLEVEMIRDRAACMIGSRSMKTQNRNLPLQ